MSIFTQFSNNTLVDNEGGLINKDTITLTPDEARALRAAAKMLRSKRYRMQVRCDACFEGNRPDGIRGEITREHISFECRCRFLQFNGQTI